MWYEGRGVLERIQLSCGHVDIDRMKIHDDNPNQKFFVGVGGMKWRYGMGAG